MIRTQVSLEREDYALAKREAKALGISVAEFVRRAVRGSLSVPAHEGQADKPWMRYIGFVESGDPNSSKTIDELVYGQKG